MRILIERFFFISAEDSKIVKEILCFQISSSTPNLPVLNNEIDENNKEELVDERSNDFIDRIELKVN